MCVFIFIYTYLYRQIRMHTFEHTRFAFDVKGYRTCQCTDQVHTCAILAQALAWLIFPPPRPDAPHFSKIFNRFRWFSGGWGWFETLASRTVSIRLTNHPPDNAIDREKEYMHAYALSETNTCCTTKGGWVGCCVHISYNCWGWQLKLLNTCYTCLHWRLELLTTAGSQRFKLMYVSSRYFRTLPAPISLHSWAIARLFRHGQTRSEAIKMVR